MDQILTEKGVILMGEAAKAYITFLYFDVCMTVVIFIVFSYAIYKGLKYMADN